MDNLFILDANNMPRQSTDVLAWASFMEQGARRQVGLTRIGDFGVSTLFLGVDHNVLGVGDPLLFETLLFAEDGPLIPSLRRYSTWAAAAAGHQECVAAVHAEMSSASTLTTEILAALRARW